MYTDKLQITYTIYFYAELLQYGLLLKDLEDKNRLSQ